MQLKKIDADFTVCKLKNPDGIDMTQEYCFIGKTDEELSLVCETKLTPNNTVERLGMGRQKQIHQTDAGTEY